MATQGIVSIIENGEMKTKIVAGCNGFNAEGLAERIEAEGLQYAMEIYQAARSHSFGCADCLVVIDEDIAVTSGFDLDSRYRSTFNEPEINPRWHHGTASHVRVIQRHT